MSLYLGDNLISGVATPVEPTRNVGQIIESIVPLTDAGLHLLDGALINGSGIYADFVTYIADLYANTQSAWKTYVQPTNPSGITSTNGFSNPSNAFDNDPSTYASCGTTTDYIEWDLGETLKVSGFNATIQWVSGSASSCNISIYSVDGNNNETLIANGSGVPQGASGTSSAQFSGIEVSKLRFKCIPNDGGQSPTTSTPSRVAQINIIAQREVKPIFCTEQQWQTSVTTYGVCGKFVYDSVNNTVRLPKITGIVEGTTDLTALGDLVEAGLPNITGEIQRGNYGPIRNTGDTSGAFDRDNTQHGYNNGMNGEANDSAAGFNFDASRSSSIYGNSTTVQPQTIKVLYYIVIATTTKTEIEVDIDTIATDLNGKADRDLINLTNGLTNTICSTAATTTSSASSARPAVVVENYVNGTSWYRVWSDGWCEQGGVSPSAGDSSSNTINLLKSYKDTNYSIFFAQNAGVEGSYTNGCTAKNKTVSSFILVYRTGGTASFYWQACGYIN